MKNRFKRQLLILPVAAAMMTAASWPAAAEPAAVKQSLAQTKQLKLNTMSMIINGKAAEVPAALAGGETYIGLRFLSEKLGLAVQWEKSAGSITVSSKNKKMTMKPGSNDYILNGHRLYGSEPAAVQNTTYLPLRFLLEQMGFTIGYDNQSKTVKIEAVTENELKLSNHSIAIPGKSGELKVEYPQLSGWKDQKVQKQINSILKQEAESYEQAAKRLVKESATWGLDDEQQKSIAYSADYVVTYNEQDKLSLYFTNYIYSGGAHGMYDYQAHTFDLNTGEELTLQQAAGGHPNYVNIINNEVKRQMKQKKDELLYPFESIDANQRYYLRGKNIVVYFSLYEYFPYSSGIPTIAVPLSAFKQ